MGEILINTDSLAAEIGRLYTLGAKIAASSIACPAVVGGGSSVQEIENLGHRCYYFPSFEEIENFLMKNCTKDDLLITMGAGDVVKIGENLLRK